MARPSIRESILEAGQEVLWESGYSVGVRDIVARAGARPGSFTNHFDSKERFAEEVLERYFAYVTSLVNEAMEAEGLTPVQRLRRYLDIITSKLAASAWKHGCLIGNFSLEAVDHSELLRQRLMDIFLRWRAPFAACIAEGQSRGEITTAFSADDLADFLLSSWQGAILRTKVERSAAPLERFKAIVFATLFQETGS